MSKDFSKEGMKERPKCERCNKRNAIRAIPLKDGTFRCLCNKCYIYETETAKRKILKNEIIKELSKQYKLVPRNK